MSTAPPQHNATLSKITGAGVADDWDRPAEEGAVKWAGEARGYYRETTTREQGANGATNIATKRELVITMDTLDELDLDTDDVLTFTVDGDETEQTGTAQSIPRVRLAGVPAEVQTSRIRFENA